jgi:hypothetical protein
LIFPVEADSTLPFNDETTIEDPESVEYCWLFTRIDDTVSVEFTVAKSTKLEVALTK